MDVVKSNEIEEFAATFPDRKEEIFKLYEGYNKLIAELEVMWDELKLLKPKNIMPEEKKKYAAAVFEVCAKHNVKNFTGLYFGLADGKIESIENYMFNYDDKALYKIL